MGATKETAAPAGPVASTAATGKEITGAVVSTTSIENDSVALLPLMSVTVHVTVCEPNAALNPDAGVHDGVAVTPTMSVAAGGAYVTAVCAPVASTVRSLVRMSGGVVSTMFRVKSCVVVSAVPSVT